MTSTKTQEIADTWYHGNISTAHKWVGNSARRLCAIQEALGEHGSETQRQHLLSFRIFTEK